MNRNKKKRMLGFTLIELLAVIIILAVIALIAAPVVLKVVDNAKESSRKSSVAGYADTIRLAINEKMFQSNGSVPIMDSTFLGSLTYQGETVSCNDVINSNNYGVILHECIVGSNTNLYCYLSGKVYNCDDAEYINIYNTVKSTSGEEISNVEVNAPQLATGMTPIKWIDGVETPTTSDDSDWYDYSNKLWANAKTADGSYWVWIPRYAYKIINGWHTSTAGTIDVVFLKNDTNQNSKGLAIQTGGYSTTGTNTSNAYFLEPAFFDSNSYGFWVAKFEPSGTSTNIKILPNAISLRSMTIGNQFTSGISMKNNSNYGWNSSEIDTHMMINSEWGAVAYLSWSIYGKNSEVWINNSSTFVTGCAGNSVSSNSYGGCQNTYNSEIGVNASTTGNITGIYDMSGGAWENMATYVANGNTNLSTYGSTMINSSSAFKTTYIKGIPDDQGTNYSTNKNIYGDAVYETSKCVGGNCSWNSDYSYLPSQYYAWFVRGENYTLNVNTGLFGFRSTTGESDIYHTFRPVVSIIQ